MRTVLVLDKEVVQKAKAFAAEQGISLNQLASRALLDYLAQAKKTSRISDTLKNMPHTGRGRKILTMDVLNAIRDDGR